VDIDSSFNHLNINLNLNMIINLNHYIDQINNHHINLNHINHINSIIDHLMSFNLFLNHLNHYFIRLVLLYFYSYYEISSFFNLFLLIHLISDLTLIFFISICLFILNDTYLLKLYINLILHILKYLTLILLNYFKILMIYYFIEINIF
jgi:hypothetical protein